MSKQIDDTLLAVKRGHLSAPAAPIALLLKAQVQ